MLSSSSGIFYTGLTEKINYKKTEIKKITALEITIHTYKVVLSY